jgi:hypothetical protein
MDTQLWQQVRNVFHATLELPLDQRAAYLDKSCAGWGHPQNQLPNKKRRGRFRKPHGNGVN